MHETRYVLITPAKNEEAFIERTIRSVLSQTVQPNRWILVNDGSTDRTEETIRRYSEEYEFISLVTTEGAGVRHFGSKVNAFNAGYSRLAVSDYAFIGNLDADVSFELDYFEKLLLRFHENPRLGIAGGIISELIDKHYMTQKISLNSVAGAVQLFRRRCFEEIGGYVPLRFGGIDSAAEIMARAKGWEVQTFPDLKVLHHRRVMSGQGNVLRTCFRHGITHYLLGYDPVFETMRCLVRILDRPAVIGKLAVISGYFWACLRRYKRQLPADIVKHLRAEQKARIFKAFTANR